MTNNLDIFAYMNSKFIYVERHLKTQITQLYQAIIDHKCRMEAQVIRNALVQTEQDLVALHYAKAQLPSQQAKLST